MSEAVPSGWNEVPVRKIASIITGPFGTLLKASEYGGPDGVPLISVGEIRDGFLRVTDETPRVETEVTSRLPQYLLKEGDIVFGRKGGVERSARVLPEHVGWFLGSDGISIRVKDGLNSTYFGHAMRSKQVQGWLLQNASGTTMPSLNQVILGSVVIRYPDDPHEQQAIAKALSEADGVVAGLERVIAKKRLIKQGAMQDLLTARRRLPGFSGECEVKKLGDVARFGKGKGLPKSDVLSAGPHECIHYGSLFREQPAVISEVHTFTTQFDGAVFSDAGDVLMPTSDVTPSGLAVASCIPKPNVILGGDILIIKPDTGALHGQFLSLVIRNSKTQIMELVSGTTVFHIYAGDMAGFTFAAPSVAEQKAIAAVLSDMDTEIQTLETRLTKARAIKEGMMQNLLTGRVRLV